MKSDTDGGEEFISAIAVCRKAEAYDSALKLFKISRQLCIAPAMCGIVINRREAAREYLVTI